MLVSNLARQIPAQTTLFRQRFLGHWQDNDYHGEGGIYFEDGSYFKGKANAEVFKILIAKPCLSRLLYGRVQARPG